MRAAAVFSRPAAIAAKRTMGLMCQMPVWICPVNFSDVQQLEIGNHSVTGSAPQEAVGGYH